jgi:hypothetical protein
VLFLGRVEEEGPLEVAVDVETVETLALLLRLVEAVSESSLMIPRSENDGRGLEVESTKPNYKSAVRSAAASFSLPRRKELARIEVCSIGRKCSSSYQ